MPQPAELDAHADPLFAPHRVGDLWLPNRVLMAPMTRCRATLPELVPNDLMAVYYHQRAAAGLIFSEGTQVDPTGLGYVGTPGIHSEAQRDGWREVTDAVHAGGGRIFAQLWHVGRVSHPDFQPDGQRPLAPSALKPDGLSVHTQDGKKPVPEPRALDADELPGVADRFRHAAQIAKDAGFDGVQLHGANGYLIDEFLRTATNHRTDDFGGSVQNRVRFPLMVVEAILQVWPKERVGVRVSPTGTFNEMSDADPVETFTHFAEQLNQRGLCFIEVVGKLFDQEKEADEQATIDREVRRVFDQTFIANGDYDAASARAAIRDGKADLVSFGRPFLANADLPERFRLDTELNEPDGDTLYDPTAGARGYTDYPALAPDAGVPAEAQPPG